MRPLLGLCLACVLHLLPSSASAQSARTDALKWLPWFEIGGFASTERSRTEAAFWLPLAQSNTSVFFADIRGKLFEDEQREGNLAVGYRQMVAGGWNVGGWLGYDRRQTSFGSMFGQLSLGVEALHRNWDLRANAYLPTEADRLIAQSQSTSVVVSNGTPNVQLTGGNILLVTDTFVTSTSTLFQSRELALRGFDAEIGYKLPLAWAAPTSFATSPEKNEIRVYAGAFAFEHKDLDRNIVGPKFRAEWRINDILPGWAGSRLTLEAEHRWDEIRGHQQEAGLKLRIPFGADGGPPRLSSLTSQERRMSESVRRDTDIVTQSKTTSSTSTTRTATQTTEKVADVATGVTFDRAVIVSNGSDLQAALTTAGTNSLIIAQGGVTPFGRATLVVGQTLLGGGATIPLRGITSGIVVDYTAPGVRPLLYYAGNNNVLVLDSNTHVSGLNIRGGGGQTTPLAGNGGIFGGNTAPFGTPGLTNIVVENNNIYDIGQRAVSFGGNNSDIIVRNNHIYNIAEVGIGFYNVNSNITISGNVVENTGYGSIGLGDNSTNITIVGNLMANTGFLYGALQISANSKIVAIAENTFSGSVGQKMIDFQGSGSEIVTAKSVGNIDLVTQVFGSKCVANSATAFTGSVFFTSGLVFTDNVAPCN